MPTLCRPTDLKSGANIVKFTFKCGLFYGKLHSNVPMGNCSIILVTNHHDPVGHGVDGHGHGPVHGVARVLKICMIEVICHNIWHIILEAN